jgi:hypothetical protein
MTWMGVGADNFEVATMVAPENDSFSERPGVKSWITCPAPMGIVVGVLSSKRGKSRPARGKTAWLGRSVTVTLVSVVAVMAMKSPMLSLPVPF